MSHHLRTKLDELKRQEMERLKHLSMQKYEESRGLGIKHSGRLRLPGHLNHKTLTFEADDLEKLLKKFNRDMEALDRQRRDAFKQYEMEKELRHREQMEQIADMEKRKAEEAAWEEAKKKHANHPKVMIPSFFLLGCVC